MFGDGKIQPPDARHSAVKTVWSTHPRHVLREFDIESDSSNSKVSLNAIFLSPYFVFLKLCCCIRATLRFVFRRSENYCFWFLDCHIVSDKTKLAVLDTDGSPVKLFDFPQSANFNNGIRWTPNGNALTYQDWNNGIWRQNLDGGEPERFCILRRTDFSTPRIPNFRVLFFLFTTKTVKRKTAFCVSTKFTI